VFSVRFASSEKPQRPTKRTGPGQTHLRSKSSGKRKGKGKAAAAVQESEDEKTARLEVEEFETQMELQRLRGEQLRLKRKMLGKRDLGDICKSPMAKFLLLQLGLCLLYYVFVELRPKGDEDYEYEF
jgi:hypothetical protein